jgi:hypothetical protein
LIACYTNKLLCSWDLNTKELIGSCYSNKKPTALTLAPLPDQPHVEVLLVSDKGGEIWAMSLPDLAKKVRLFGHTGSVITDTLVTKILSSSSSLSILTADRDEKIRITEFPATHTIQSYLLGHHDVITTLALHQPQSQPSLENGFVLSAGWDHQLCLWSKRELSLSDSIQLNQESKIAEVSLDSGAGDVTEAQGESMEQPQGEGDDGDSEGEIEAADVVNGNDDENRPFDASQAGSFPMRIIPSSTLFPSRESHLSLSPIALICWQSSDIKIFVLEELSSSSSSSAEVQGRFRRSSELSSSPTSTTLPLPAPPIDCLWFSHQNQLKLIVLLPSPHCLQIYSLHLDAEDCFQCEQTVGDGEGRPLFDGLLTINEYIRANGESSVCLSVCLTVLFSSRGIFPTHLFH